PVIATPHRLIVVSGQSGLSILSLDPILGITVSKDNRLLVQTSKGLFTPSAANKLVALPGSAKPPRGRLISSVSDLYLDNISDQTGTKLLLVKSGGRPVPLLNDVGVFRSASWSTLGLSVVYGNSLLIWPDGAPQGEVLASDSGL